MRRLILLTLCLLAASVAFAQKKGSAPAPAAPAGPGPKSQAEVQAVNAAIQAQTADDRIKAVDDLITKFPNTDFKSFALMMEAESWQAKGDNVKAIVFGEQALQADPKNFDADNLLANVLAATTRDTDLDKDDKLTRADKYAHDSLDILNTGVRPFTTPEATWPKVKADAQAQAWQALGMVAIVRKKSDEAIADFQKGIDANASPLLMVRVGRVLLAQNKNDEAITWYDKALASPNVPAQVKSIAEADKARAVAAKGSK
ncbi:MAG: tetratricopeptide repeat protein [Bryobacteraceae bacterium]|jgi:tetratricopeptide (TPR) repeat protein